MNMAKEKRDDKQQAWQPLKLPALAERLAEVRNLLRQAAAVGLAQDVARVESLQTLQQASDIRAKPQPRRYR
jgi:hypothetical protein